MRAAWWSLPLFCYSTALTCSLACIPDAPAPSSHRDAGAADRGGAAAIAYNLNLAVGHSVDYQVGQGSAVYLLAAATTGTGSPEIKILDPVPHITGYWQDLPAEPQEFTISGRRFRAGSVVILHPYPHGVGGSACSIVSSSDTQITAVVCQPPGDRAVSVRCDSTGRESELFPVTVSPWPARGAPPRPRLIRADHPRSES